MDYTLIISPIVAVLTAIIGYKTGRRNRENEATRVAFENYKFALESLRNEFEARINALQKENEELRREIKELKDGKKKLHNNL